MFSTILVAVDGSDAAARAATVAATLAAQNGATLHILNTPLDETAALVMSGVGGYVPIAPIMDTQALTQAGGQIVASTAELCAKAGAKTIVEHVRPGRAAQEVVRLADEIDADLIVTGRRGLGSIASTLLGSTSHAILNAAKCACLSVP